MAEFKKIAVVGGFGDLGKHVTAAILAEGARFELTLISRKLSESPGSTAIKQVEVGDYIESERLTRALVGQDVLLSFHNTAAAPEGNF